MLKFITHRPLWINVVTGIVLAFLILFLFIFSLKWCTHHNESKTVPSVTGKVLAEAEKILDDAGFNIEIMDSIYTDTSKPLTVIKQVPEAEEMVKVNRKVYLTINRAVPPDVEMPNLSGYSYRSAEMSLRNANLRVGDTIYRPDFARNTVLQQLYDGNPVKPGTKLKMGSAIDLVLGDGVGQEKFLVPIVIGRRFCDAKSALAARGLDIGAIVVRPGIELSDTCAAYIYDQTPKKFDGGMKPIYVRSGQLIDVWLQEEQPVSDSLSVTHEPGEPE